MEVHGITTARRGQRDDVHVRMVRYAVSMAIRMVCLVLAFVVEGWASWIFVAGAVLLPYVAVLMANAGRETAPRAPATLIGTGTAAPAAQHGPAAAPQPLALGSGYARTAPAATATRPLPARTSPPRPAPGRRAPSRRPAAAGQWQHSYAPPAGWPGTGPTGSSPDARPSSGSTRARAS